MEISDLKNASREMHNAFNELDEETKPDFWTKPKKQLVFASSFLLLTPLIYFETTNPAFRADTLDLMRNYPLHSLAILALIIIQLRAIYKKFVLTTNKTKRWSANTYNPHLTEETEEDSTPEQNNSFWTEHKA